MKKEAEFDEIYLATPISINVQVVDENGLGVEGAEITFWGWGDSQVNNGISTTTGAEGLFLLDGLYRRNVLLRVKADGYYDEIIPLDLQRPLAETVLNIERIIMTSRREGRIRMIFAGDTMFGRRYADKDEDGIEGEPEDLIQPDTRAGDAKALTEFIRPVLLSDDYTTVNFESPVISDTSSEHPYKTYTFFSYPETLEALGYAGIDSISLGNNHVFDYLEPGFLATISNIQDTGIDWFGAGFSESDAASNLSRKTINGVDFSLQGFNGIRPINFPEGTPVPWPAEYLYSAMDTPIVKGGSLWLSKSNISNFLIPETDGRFAVPIIHGGDEYGENPTANIRSKIIHSIKSGAGLVIAHHSHSIYGIGVYGTGDASRYALLSLGNFLFDQDVFETFQSFLAVVDLDQTASGKHIIHRLRLIPFHIEGYIPKLVSGEWLARIGRHVGHLSTYLPLSAELGLSADGLRGALVFPADNGLVVLDDSDKAEIYEEEKSITVPLSRGDTGPFEYPRTTPSDMLAGGRSGSPASCRVGRELMHYGDFEDFDIDASFHEGFFWNQTDQRFIENSVVRNGTGALVLLRSPNSNSHVSTWLKNRITFPESASLTLTGYLKGNGAGEFRLQVRWYIRDSRDVISTDEVFIRAAGTYDWESFHVDITPPPGAGTVRAYLNHYPPGKGENGLLFIDDLALVSWEKKITDISGGFELDAPNNWSWLRCYTADQEQESLQMFLTHRRYSLPTGAL